MVGGESYRSRRRARRMGVDFRRDVDESLPPAEKYAGLLPMATDHEMSRGVVAPGVFYPVVETAIRHSRRESVSEHRQRVGELWSRFNAVAVENPHAAVRTPMTPDEITTPIDGNRMVATPYTRAMMANNSVDQASAVLILSVARAEALGIPGTLDFPSGGNTCGGPAVTQCALGPASVPRGQNRWPPGPCPCRSRSRRRRSPGSLRVFPGVSTGVLDRVGYRP